MMKKSPFLKMNAEQRVMVLNSLLRGGETISSIADKLAMARSSLQAPIQAAGYKFDKASKQYVFDDDLMTNPLTATEILRKLDRIEKLLRQYLVQEQEIPYIATNELIEKTPSGKEIRVTIRVNEAIWDKFNDFCKRNSNFYRKDLMGLALIEFVRSKQTEEKAEEKE